MIAWYVRPLRFVGSVGDFLLNVKIGFDLGRSPEDSVRVAWIMWGAGR